MKTGKKGASGHPNPVKHTRSETVRKEGASGHPNPVKHTRSETVRKGGKSFSCQTPGGLDPSCTEQTSAVHDQTLKNGPGGGAGGYDSGRSNGA